MGLKRGVLAMITTKTVVAVMGVAAFLSSYSLTDILLTPPPVEVDLLTFDRGDVLFERTVNEKSPAQVLNAIFEAHGGPLVQNCKIAKYVSFDQEETPIKRFTIGMYAGAGCTLCLLYTSDAADE